MRVLSASASVGNEPSTMPASSTGKSGGGAKDDASRAARSAGDVPRSKDEFAPEEKHSGRDPSPSTVPDAGGGGAGAGTATTTDEREDDGVEGTEDERAASAAAVEDDEEEDDEDFSSPPPPMAGVSFVPEELPMCDYDRDPTELYQSLEAQAWDHAFEMFKPPSPPATFWESIDQFFSPFTKPQSSETRSIGAQCKTWVARYETRPGGEDGGEGGEEVEEDAPNKVNVHATMIPSLQQPCPAGGGGAEGDDKIDKADTWEHSIATKEQDAAAAGAAKEDTIPRVMSNDDVAKLDRERKIRWRLLPIHAAVIFHAPVVIVEELLKVFPDGAKCKDDQGMLPIHLAFNRNSSDAVVDALLVAYPPGIEERDMNGRTPLQLCSRESNKSRGAVIGKYVEYQVERERVALLGKMNDAIGQSEDKLWREYSAALRETKERNAAKLEETSEEMAKKEKELKKLVAKNRQLKREAEERKRKEQEMEGKLKKMEGLLAAEKKKEKERKEREAAEAKKKKSVMAKKVVVTAPPPEPEPETEPQPQPQPQPVVKKASRFASMFKKKKKSTTKKVGKKASSSSSSSSSPSAAISKSVRAMETAKKKASSSPKAKDKAKAATATASVAASSKSKDSDAPRTAAKAATSTSEKAPSRGAESEEEEGPTTKEEATTAATATAGGAAAAAADENEAGKATNDDDDDEELDQIREVSA